MGEIGRCQNDRVDNEEAAVMSVVQKRLTVTVGLIARAIAGQGEATACKIPGLGDSKWPKKFFK